MICINWTTFRAAFNPGGAVGADGVEVWPVANVRAGSFGGAIASAAFASHGVVAWPIVLTVNALAQDASPAYDEQYDWYVSQRTDDAASQYLVVSPVAKSSGSISIAYDPTNTAKLLPGIATPSDDNSIALLFKHVHVYCRRRSDGAIDWVRLADRLLAPT